MFRIEGKSPIYLIQDGKPRHYQNEDSFLGRGYLFGNEVMVAGNVPEGIINRGTGPEITPVGRDVSFRLWFEKGGVETNTFAPGDRVTVKAQVLGDGYMAYPYLRLNGVYYYSVSHKLPTFTGFVDSSVKRPLFYDAQERWLPIPIQTAPLQNQPIPGQTIVNGTLTLGEITIPENQTQSEFQWEFWCEDVNKPTFKDTAFPIRAIPPAQASYSVNGTGLTITNLNLPQAG